MEQSTEPERRWIRPRELLTLVERDFAITGDESPADVIMLSPDLLIPIGEASTNPLDMDTYRARQARWEAKRGPRLTNMSEFMRTLEGLAEPVCAVSLIGISTNYIFLIDSSWSRVLTGVAIDPPHA